MEEWKTTIREQEVICRGHWILVFLNCIMILVMRRSFPGDWKEFVAGAEAQPWFSATYLLAAFFCGAAVASIGNQQVHRDAVRQAFAFASDTSLRERLLV